MHTKFDFSTSEKTNKKQNRGIYSSIGLREYTPLHIVCVELCTTIHQPVLNCVDTKLIKVVECRALD